MTDLRVAVAACTLVLVGAASHGSARAIELEVELGTGLGSSQALGDVLFVSPLLGLGVPLSDTFDLQLTWGFTVASASDPIAGNAATRFQAGSPLVSFPWRIGEGLVFAPGMSIPAASLPADDTDPTYAIARAAVNGGRGIRGRLDEWLWLPDELSFVLPLHIAIWAHPFIIEIDTAVAYAIPVNDIDTDDDFILQIIGRLAWRVVPNLWVGVRLGTSFIPTNTGDNAQASIAPEVRWIAPEVANGAYVGLRLHVNLDTPYGPSFEAGRIWGLHLATGWSF